MAPHRKHNKDKRTYKVQELKPEAMRLASPLGRLSRAVAGTRGHALILNTPGSSKGTVECLEAVLDVLPHALRLLAGTPTEH